MRLARSGDGMFYVLTVHNDLILYRGQPHGHLILGFIYLTQAHADAQLEALQSKGLNWHWQSTNILVAEKLPSTNPPDGLTGLVGDETQDSKKVLQPHPFTRSVRLHEISNISTTTRR